MAIDPATDVYGTNNSAQFAAVVDVDIKQANVNWPERVSAKARAVFLAGAASTFRLILGASENHIGQVGGTTIRASANFTRPNDTTTYASGDLVANSTVAGNVAATQFDIGRVANAGGMIRRVRLRKSGTAIVGASFRLHLYSAAPTVTNGDNGAWLSSGAANYVGAMDVTVDKVFSDGAAGNGVPVIGSEINFTAQTYYGLLEARGAYVPAAQEVLTLTLEVIQN